MPMIEKFRFVNILKVTAIHWSQCTTTSTQHNVHRAFRPDVRFANGSQIVDTGIHVAAPVNNNIVGHIGFDPTERAGTNS